MITFAVFTDFNGYFLFGLLEISLAVITGSSIKKEEEASNNYSSEE